MRRRKMNMNRLHADASFMTVLSSMVWRMRRWVKSFVEPGQLISLHVAGNKLVAVSQHNVFA